MILFFEIVQTLLLVLIYVLLCGGFVIRRR